MEDRAGAAERESCGPVSREDVLPALPATDTAAAVDARSMSAKRPKFVGMLLSQDVRLLCGFGCLDARAELFAGAAGTCEGLFHLRGAGLVGTHGLAQGTAELRLFRNSQAAFGRLTGALGLFVAETGAVGAARAEEQQARAQRGDEKHLKSRVHPGVIDESVP
jgi:hypothetical protein